jgi:hypothetical protein
MTKAITGGSGVYDLADLSDQLEKKIFFDSGSVAHDLMTHLAAPLLS